MRDRIQKRTKYLTVCAMLCALGVIFMALGGLIEVLDISTAVLASLLCVYAMIEMGGAYPWAIWLVTSILSLLLLPQKTPAIFYALFLGYYPVLKAYFERLPRWICIILKLVSFHAALGLIYLTLRLFLPASYEELTGGWLTLLLYAMGLACFLIYDFAVTRIITVYLFKLKKRFGLK